MARKTPAKSAKATAGPSKKKPATRKKKTAGARKRAAGRAQPSAEELAARRPNARILVVDDSKAARAQIATLLEPLNVELFFAKNGVEGARCVYLEQPNLVVSDVVMPELNGFQLCRLIKNDPLTQSIPVIMLTGLGDHQDRFWGMQAGADSYINKLDIGQKLRTDVERLLGTRRTDSFYDGSMSFVSAAEVEGSALRSKVTFLLDKMLFESTVANETKHLTAFIYHRERFVEEFFGFFGDLVEYDAAALALIDEHNSEVAIDARTPVSETDVLRVRDDAVRSMGNLKLLERLRVTVMGARAVGETGPRLMNCQIVQLMVGSETLGTLAIYSSRRETFGSAARTVLDLVGSNVAMVVKLLFLYEENRWLSIVDPLTRVYNRRYFKESLRKEFDRSRRYGNALSLLFVDIDNFKLVNDTYGHHQGDLVLREIANYITETLRKVDIISRYGGEEFVLLLPETPLQAAAIIADRLRAGIQGRIFGLDESFQVTVSVGVTAVEQGIREHIELVERADAAMYEAKRQGKNRVVVAQPPEEAPSLEPIRGGALRD